MEPLFETNIFSHHSCIPHPLSAVVVYTIQSIGCNFSLLLAIAQIFKTAPNYICSSISTPLKRIVQKGVKKFFFIHYLYISEQKECFHVNYLEEKNRQILIRQPSLYTVSLCTILTLHEVYEFAKWIHIMQCTRFPHFILSKNII